MASGNFKLTDQLTGVHVNRLNLSELEYELSIRGLSTEGNMDKKRKSLRSVLNLDRSGINLEKVNYAISFDVDIAALRKGIEEVKVLMNDWSGNGAENVFFKLTAKLCHLLGRANRVKIDDNKADQSKVKNEILINIAMMTDDCRAKYKVGLRTSTPNRPNIPLNLSQVTHTDVNNDEEISSDEEITVHSFRPPADINERSGYVPIYKWNIKFSGKREESVNSFIRDVEEHCRSRQVNRRQLLQSAGDLFQDVAKIWYRANMKCFVTWDQLVIALKAEFQPPNYDEDLYEQIKKRTQAPNETVGIYFAIMSTLFDNLSSPMSESIKVSIVRSNLLPLYQNQLALLKPGTLGELKDLCKSLEENRISVDRYVPPKTGRRVMEPELAVIEEARRCYQCGRIGHVSRECRYQPSSSRNPPTNHDGIIKCYGCGTLGVKKPQCPKCSGNGMAR